MQIDLPDVLSWEDKYRLKFINSISGYKGVHLIGTQNENSFTNVAVFNSLIHISSNPPLLGFIMRPLTVDRHTYSNIKETGSYSVNHVHKSFLKQAHFTSAKFPEDVSEFEACNLTEQYIADFKAPFVQESKVKMGLKLRDDIEIPSNGTRLIIGEIQHILIEEDYIESDGQLDLELAHDVCVTGLNQYSSVEKFKQLPYARVEEAPNFKQKERPDSVVFDEESQTYNSSLLPYGTSIGAPTINPTGVSTWKASSINSFNHTFGNKIEEIKDKYQELIEEYKVNEMLYKASMSFEPIVGKIYHLYLNEKNDDKFLSLIPPESWKKPYLGAFKLHHDKLWEKIPADTNDSNGRDE